MPGLLKSAVSWSGLRFIRRAGAVDHSDSAGKLMFVVHPADAGGASGLTSGLPTPEENRSTIRLFRKMRTDVNDAGINGVARASFPSGSAQATTSPAPD
jgi:hypothetical protein